MKTDLSSSIALQPLLSFRWPKTCTIVIKGHGVFKSRPNRNLDNPFKNLGVENLTHCNDSVRRCFDRNDMTADTVSIPGFWQLWPLEWSGSILRLVRQRQQAQQPLRHGHGQWWDASVRSPGRWINSAACWMSQGFQKQAFPCQGQGGILQKHSHGKPCLGAL